MFPVINSTSDRNYCGMIDTIASITSTIGINWDSVPSHWVHG